jgi:uncharacterized protein YjbJ (UPF0337 family)
MNADRIEGLFRQLKGKLLKFWGRLSGDHALVLRGQASDLAGAAQASFGRAMGARWTLGLRRRMGV